MYALLLSWGNLLQKCPKHLVPFYITHCFLLSTLYESVISGEACLRISPGSFLT